MDKSSNKSLSLFAVESQDKKIRHEPISQNELVLQSIAEGICVVATDEKIIFANASAAANLGYEPEEIVGKNYYEVLFGKNNDKTLFCPIKFALSEGETSHVNTETFFRRDGSNFLVEYVCVPLIEDEKIVGSVITFEDITERREIETVIAEARDAALENVRARAAFLANMSHEIRTPLNGIIGTTDLLLNSKLDQKQINYVEMLKTSADLLLEIVNEILNFSKIEAGKRELEIVEFDVRQTLSEAINLFSALAKKKNIALNFKIDDRIPPSIFGDSSQLRQVLNNLLSNAVKFTEVGGVHAKVTLKEQNTDALILLFEVFDSGIGIKPDAIKNIFEPFAQAEISTTRRFGGTGLGLAICRRIVEMMEGEINLESREAEGTRFWFTAKFAKNGDKLEAKSSEKKEEIIFSQNQPAQFKAENVKVLIVEDNPVNREIAKAMLEQLGIVAETADNGAKAVEVCRQKSFDIILMDCRMPEMDGFEAARKILEKTDLQPPPKIIALTASVSTVEREQCFSAGMSDFLTKPITQNAIGEILKKHCFDRISSQNLDLNEKFVQHSFSDILNPEILKNFIEIESRGEENFVREMLELFCSYTESGIEELGNALSEKNIEIIKQKAHGLKGSSVNIGASGLPEFFGKLEEKAIEENWTEIGEIISEITVKFSHIKNTIEKQYENG
jgi:PAS domain S-box-containing protein